MHAFSRAASIVSVALFVGVLLFGEQAGLGTPQQSTTVASHSFEVLFPDAKVPLTDIQTFQVVNPYPNTTVTWQIPDSDRKGVLNSTTRGNFQDHVDVSSWNWNRDGIYNVVFEVKDQQTGQTLAALGREVYANIVPQTLDDNGSTHAQPSSKVTFSNTRRNPFTATASEALSGRSEGVTVLVGWLDGNRHEDHTQEFAITIPSQDISTVTWSVEGGHDNVTHYNEGDNAHIAKIHFKGWRWKDDGPYELTFTARDENFASVGSTTIVYNRQGDQVSFSGQTVVNPPAPEPDPVIIETPEPDPQEEPSGQEDPEPTPTPRPRDPDPKEESEPEDPSPEPDDSWEIFTSERPVISEVAKLLEKVGRTDDARKIGYIANAPAAVWLNGNDDDGQRVDAILDQAVEENKVPAFVLYSIPNRNCSFGDFAGAQTVSDYKDWIDDIAFNLQGRRAIFVVEPDALAMVNCLSSADKANRYRSLRYAVDEIGQIDNTKVFLDAGHANWVGVGEMADRIAQVNARNMDGFAVNVSNFIDTPASRRYADQLSNVLGGVQYVIDSSRNGSGPTPDYQWCNPWNRTVGRSSTVYNTNDPLFAELWIKIPGESDGYCNGGPGAGQFWLEYALNITREI